MKKFINSSLFGILILTALFLNACSAGGGQTGSDGGGEENNTSDVASLVAVAGNQSVQLTWDDPTYSSFDHVEITYNPGSGTVQSVVKGTETYTIAGLTNSTEYTITVKTVDDAGVKSTGVIIKSIPDETVPLNITTLTNTTGIGKIILNWIDPSDANFDHVEITWSPNGSAVQTVSKETEIYTATGLTNGIPYTFTIKAVDSDGDKSAGVTATITAAVEVLNITAQPSNGGTVLSWNDPTYSAYDHVEITWNNGGSAIQSVPKGVKTYTATGLTNGTDYTFTIKTVDNTGNKSSGITINSTPAHQYFAYVTHYSSNKISVFTINSSTGELSQITGSSYATGDGPASAVVDPSGKFIYVANKGSNNISVYSINNITGALTEITGSPYNSGNTPWSVTVDPTGKFVYAANTWSDTISAYTINSVTGALAAVTGSPIIAGDGPTSITVDPTGKFVYVTHPNSNNISAYTINPGNGALNVISGSPFPTGIQSPAPQSIIVDPSGKFVYVATHTNVLAYKINSTTGALTAVTGSPFACGYQGISITIDPAGKFVYAVNAGSKDIYAYSINLSTGALTAIAGSPFDMGATPSSIAVDPAGKFVYVANQYSNKISIYIINSNTGALTTGVGSPFELLFDPSSIITIMK